jgi:hypothetical protein
MFWASIKSMHQDISRAQMAAWSLQNDLWLNKAAYTWPFRWQLSVNVCCKPAFRVCVQLCICCCMSADVVQQPVSTSINTLCLCRHVLDIGSGLKGLRAWAAASVCAGYSIAFCHRTHVVALYSTLAANQRPVVCEKICLWTSQCADAFMRTYGKHQMAIVRTVSSHLQIARDFQVARNICNGCALHVGCFE